MEEENYGTATDGAHVKKLEDKNKPKEVSTEVPSKTSNEGTKVEAKSEKKT